MIPPPEPSANPWLFGHDAAQATFARARREGRLAHGWLIIGPRGVGKATLAFRLARTLLGTTDAPAGDPQDPAHPVFRMVANRAHPDFRPLELASDQRGRLRSEIVVDQAREVIERLRATAATHGHRVLLADPADLLNRNAANALLKLLEEPPLGVVLLLVVQRPGLLPRTIASRCAVLRLRPLDEDSMRRALARLLPELTGEPLDQAIELAEGSPGRAVEIATSAWLEHYAQLVRLLGTGAPGDRLRAAELLAARSRDGGVEQALEPLAWLCRRAATRLAAGRLRRDAVAGEGEALDRLGRRLGLEGLFAIWEKRAALVARIDDLKLDLLQSMLQIVEAGSAEIGI